jgi:hypothetical protein
MADEHRPTIILSWEEARMILGALETAAATLSAAGSIEEEIEAVEALAVLTLKMYGGFIDDEGA